MPRRNNRDRRYELKDYDSNSSKNQYDTEKKKPVRRRKGKNDKSIYRSED